MEPGRRLRTAMRSSDTAALVVLCVLVAIGGSVLSWAGVTLLHNDAARGVAFWPSCAAGAVLLLIIRRRWWPAVLAVFAAAVWAGLLVYGLSPGVATTYALANAAEAGVVAGVTRHITDIRRYVIDQVSDPINDWRNAACFAVACLLGVSAGSVVIAGGLAMIGSGSMLTVRGFALGHLTGLLVLAPTLLSLPRTKQRWREVFAQRRINVEWAGVAALVVVLGGWLFFGAADRALSYTLIVPLLLAAERFDTLRTTSVLLLACIVATLGSFHGTGPFASFTDPPERLIALQASLVVHCAITLSVMLMAHRRRYAHLMLRDSQRLLDLAFHRAPTGLYIASLMPGRVGQLWYVNEALCRLLHAHPKELLGRNTQTLSAPEDAETAASELAMLERGELDSLTCERALRRADGVDIPTVQAFNVVRSTRGQPYLVAHIMDERHRIEAERAMADALRVEAKALTQLRQINEARVAAAARLAHDLRSPLTVARAYQELVGTGAAGELTEEQARMVEISLRSTDKVIDLVDDLVTTASTELERIDVSNRRRLPVGQVLAAALGAVQSSAEQKALRLTGPTEHLEDEIFVDQVQMERALVNVLSNAVKYTPEHGHIAVSVLHDAGGIGISVSDSGIGVAPEQIKRLGEQFFRADTARLHGIKGVGLGLAVAKAVLAKHDGDLTVSSTLDRGSTFTLWLPQPAPQFLDRPAGSQPVSPDSVDLVGTDR